MRIPANTETPTSVYSNLKAVRQTSICVALCSANSRAPLLLGPAPSAIERAYTDVVNHLAIRPLRGLGVSSTTNLIVAQAFRSKRFRQKAKNSESNCAASL